LRTFEVAETDGLFHPAEATVEDGRLKVWSEAVKHPHYVRYGWQPFTQANLVNDAGLPASTFRAEDLDWMGKPSPDPYEEAFRFFLHTSREFCQPALPVSNKVGWRSMKGSPKGEKGFELGVSACFAGVVNGRLLMAGGCNFPDVPAADGGRKRYYRGIYAAPLPADSVLLWRKVGELPMPLAYGASVPTADGLICIGGMNAEGSTAGVCRISLTGDGKSVRIEPLPSLPYALDNLTGSLMGNTVYVAGGNRQGAASNTFLCLDLERPGEGWKELTPFPGNPRIQPVSAGVHVDGAYRFFLWGGFAPASQGREATLSVNGYCYDPTFDTWIPVPTPTGRNGESVSLGGGTAVALADGRILCMGGVDKDIFLSALRSPAKDYLRHPAEWYRFNRRILLYDVAANSWQEVAEVADAARAGAALVGGNGACFYIGGELKPGIRIPGVTKINLK
ncbi:cyclically-permuted mutarotase family protein, partial [Bacteroides heparinolyticus]|uniref:cyclically-permuted mutarotase family protein n=1 Tax=Prevotella heparinolytica TaxID=28113 RepID=UPI0035A155EA